MGGAVGKISMGIRALRKEKDEWKKKYDRMSDDLKNKVSTNSSAIGDLFSEVQSLSSRLQRMEEAQAGTRTELKTLSKFSDSASSEMGKIEQRMDSASERMSKAEGFAQNQKPLFESWAKEQEKDLNSLSSESRKRFSAIEKALDEGSEEIGGLSSAVDTMAKQVSKIEGKMSEHSSVFEPFLAEQEKNMEKFRSSLKKAMDGLESDNVQNTKVLEELEARTASLSERLAKMDGGKAEKYASYEKELKEQKAGLSEMQSQLKASIADFRSSVENGLDIREKFDDMVKQFMTMRGQVEEKMQFFAEQAVKLNEIKDTLVKQVKMDMLQPMNRIESEQKDMREKQSATDRRVTEAMDRTSINQWIGSLEKIEKLINELDGKTMALEKGLSTDIPSLRSEVIRQVDAINEMRERLRAQEDRTKSEITGVANKMWSLRNQMENRIREAASRSEYAELPVSGQQQEEEREELPPASADSRHEAADRLVYGHEGERKKKG